MFTHFRREVALLSTPAEVLHSKGPDLGPVDPVAPKPRSRAVGVPVGRPD